MAKNNNASRTFSKLGFSMMTLGIKIAGVGALTGLVVDVCTGGATMGGGFVIGASIGGAIGGVLVLAGAGVIAYGAYVGYQENKAKHASKKVHTHDRDHNYAPSPETRRHLSSMRSQRPTAPKAAHPRQDVRATSPWIIDRDIPQQGLRQPLTPSRRFK